MASERFEKSVEGLLKRGDVVPEPEPKKPRAGKIIPQYITAGDKTQTITAWAKEQGTSTHTIAERWKKVQAGKMTEDDFLHKRISPVELVHNNKKNSLERTNKIRVKSLETLFSAIDRNVLPKIEGEIKACMQGEQDGPGLKLLYKWRTLLPVQKLDEILDAHKGIKANFAFIMGQGQTQLPGKPTDNDIEIIK